MEEEREERRVRDEIAELNRQNAPFKQQSPDRNSSLQQQQQGNNSNSSPNRYSNPAPTNNSSQMGTQLGLGGSSGRVQNTPPRGQQRPERQQRSVVQQDKHHADAAPQQEFNVEALPSKQVRGYELCLEDCSSVPLLVQNQASPDSGPGQRIDSLCLEDCSSVPLLSCSITTGALGSSGLLSSCSITIMAISLHITT